MFKQHNKSDKLARPLSTQILGAFDAIYSTNYYFEHLIGTSELYTLIDSDIVKARAKAFFGIPEPKNKYFYGDLVSYFLGGFVLNPIKNIVKIFAEFLPKIAELVFANARVFLNQKIKDKNTNPLVKAACLIAYPFCMLGEYIPKLIRVILRTATSPILSYRAAVKTGVPGLGVLSILMSAGAFISLAIFFPVALLKLSAVLPQVGGAALKALHFLSHVFQLHNVTLGMVDSLALTSIVVAASVSVLAAAKKLINKLITKCFTKENKPNKSAQKNSPEEKEPKNEGKLEETHVNKPEKISHNNQTKKILRSTSLPNLKLPSSIEESLIKDKNDEPPINAELFTKNVFLFDDELKKDQEEINTLHREREIKNQQEETKQQAQETIQIQRASFKPPRYSRRVFFQHGNNIGSIQIFNQSEEVKEENKKFNGEEICKELKIGFEYKKSSS